MRYPSSAKPTVSCIINPRAANKKWQRRKTLRKRLQKYFPGQIIDGQKNKSQTIQIAKSLCETKQILVAAGGDGTIADVIQGIMDSNKNNEVMLGIIPLGSGNAFRKSLGIPQNVKRALKLIAKKPTRKMDLIDVEGKSASFISIGATASVSREKSKNKIPGLLGHLWASRILMKKSDQPLDIELVDGIDDKGNQFRKKTLHLKVFDCVISKTKYFGYNWRIAPKAQINDGYLDITLFEGPGSKYLLLFPFIYFGLYQETQKHFKAKSLKIRGKDLAIQYHGEILGVKDKISIKVLPRVLKVISPHKNSNQKPDMHKKDLGWN
ncbi:hypothetical protein KGY73_09465 [bacterium]|nr:hypothetical protein [bacterium]